MATWEMFSKVAISLSSGIWASLKKISLAELGIQTFLVSLPVSMKNTVLGGTGFGWAIGCTLVWVEVGFGATGRDGRLLGVTVGVAGFTLT